MKQLIESGAARIAARIQSVGANFDIEVLSLPGGSVIAVLLWLYTSSMATVKRARLQYRVVDKESTIDARQVLRAVACSGTWLPAKRFAIKSSPKALLK